MSETRLLLAVLARAHPPASAWSGRMLRPSAVMMPAPPLPPNTRLSTDQSGVETWSMGQTTLVLHPGDAGNMRKNLSMAVPSLWIALRDADTPARASLHIVSADPFEGEAMATDPGLSVAAVPMPRALRDHIAAYVALFPEDAPFRKKKRSSIEAEDPLRQAPRILPGGYAPDAPRRRAYDAAVLDANPAKDRAP